jgi:hypothetical protein
MPTTLIGLCILVVLLGPGFCYVAAIERRFTARKQSAFRETVQIAAASVFLNLLVLLPFWIIHTNWSAGTPNVDAIVVTPHSYWVHHYRLVSSWALILVVAACLLGFLAGSLVRAGKSVNASAWVQMFQANPKDEKWIGAELVDGSYIAGQLFSYSMDPEETNDRELVLRAPEYRGPDQEKMRPLESGLTTISAGQIRFVSVSYNPAAPPPDKDPLKDRLRNAWKVARGTARATETDESDSEANGEGHPQLALPQLALPAGTPPGG